jgi:shikimate dehydrogenase
LKRQFGLIGYPLSHSFSGKYFAEKFQREGIPDARYDLFEIDAIDKVDQVFAKPNLLGFNVTIPYKHGIKAYMDDFDHSAKKVGAVNVVKINGDGTRTGFNSDYYGFRTSLESWLPEGFNSGAMVLGIGGAAKAVMAVLDDLSINYVKISRDSSKGDYDYESLKANPDLLQKHKLIINTTPLGMSPNTDARPAMDYSQMDERFYLYDLIYNPAETRFMRAGKAQGAQVKNGLEMLELQAEKSWEIWNT